MNDDSGATSKIKISLFSFELDQICKLYLTDLLVTNLVQKTVFLYFYC
jgi:hypothetical protein